FSSIHTLYVSVNKFFDILSEEGISGLTGNKGDLPQMNAEVRRLNRGLLLRGRQLACRSVAGPWHGHVSLSSDLKNASQNTWQSSTTFICLTQNSRGLTSETWHATSLRRWVFHTSYDVGFFTPSVSLIVVGLVRLRLGSAVSLRLRVLI